MAEDRKDFIELYENDMSNYIEQSFKNPDVQKFLNSAEDMTEMERRYRNIGGFISVYATATGDLSQSAVSKIVKDMSENTSLLQDKQAYFKEVLGPMIVDYHCRKSGVSDSLDVESVPKLLKAVYVQSKNNFFETHSFNGSLIDEVKTNGLDIHKEKFLAEFKMLKKVGMRQPFQYQGELLFCELNSTSFGYALRSPEKLEMALSSDFHQPQGKTQSNRDYYNQMLDEAVKKMPQSDRNSIAKAGQTMIDFYFPTDQNKSAIAVKKGPKLAKESMAFDEDMWRNFTYFPVSTGLRDFCRQKDDTESMKSYEEALREYQKSKNPRKIAEFVRKFNQQYPENNPIKEAQKEFLYQTIRTKCVNNYDCATTTGMVIKGGRLAPTEFSLAVIDNPIDQYARCQRQAEKDNEITWGMLCGSDGKNYRVPFDKDGKPIMPDYLKQKEEPKKRKELGYGFLFGPDGKNYRVLVDENGKLVIPEYLKPKEEPKKGLSERLSQVSDQPLIKQKKLEISEAFKKKTVIEKKEDNSVEQERQRKREEIRRQMEVKKGLSL